jgi:hypothetical protein
LAAIWITSWQRNSDVALKGGKQEQEEKKYLDGYMNMTMFLTRQNYECLDNCIRKINAVF